MVRYCFADILLLIAVKRLWFQMMISRSNQATINIWMSEWKSGWLLLNTKWVLFQLYCDENKLHFNEMMLKSTLCQTNSPRRDISLHSNIVSSFRADQSVLLLLNTSFLSEKQQIPVSKSLVWPDQSSNPRSIAHQVEHVNHYTTDVVTFGWTANLPNKKIDNNHTSLWLIWLGCVV